MSKGFLIACFRVQFEYPDCYDADDPQPCAQDANLLLQDEVEAVERADVRDERSEAVSRLGSDPGAREL